MDKKTEEQITPTHERLRLAFQGIEQAQLSATFTLKKAWTRTQIQNLQEFAENPAQGELIIPSAYLDYGTEDINPPIIDMLSLMEKALIEAELIPQFAGGISGIYTVLSNQPEEISQPRLSLYFAGVKKVNEDLFLTLQPDNGIEAELWIKEGGHAATLKLSRPSPK